MGRVSDRRRGRVERAAAAEAGDDANGADGDDNDGEPKELTENQKKKLKKYLAPQEQLTYHLTMMRKLFGVRVRWD